MRDLTSPRLMYLKALLFLVIGLIASGIILLDHPSLKLAALLALAIWAFARAYYFAFYVIEHYIDPTYRFAGLASALRHAFTRPARKRKGRRVYRLPSRRNRSPLLESVILNQALIALIFTAVNFCRWPTRL